MKREEIIEKARAVFIESFGTRHIALIESEDAIFRSLKNGGPIGLDELDSLDQIEFVMAIEAQFGVDFTDEQASAITNIPMAVSEVERALAGSIGRRERGLQ